MTRTNAYNNTFIIAKQGGQLEMTDAVEQATASSNQSFATKPTYSCPTVNCTWPTYASLAVCSHCANVTSHIVTDHANTTFQTDQGALFQSPSVRYSLQLNPTGPSPSEVATGFFVNQYPFPVLQNPIGVRSDFLNYSSQTFATYTTGHPNKTLNFTDSENLLWSLLTIFATVPYVADTVGWESMLVNAIECGLSLCTNAYTGKVVNGTLIESMSSTASTRNPDSYMMIPSAQVNTSDGLQGPVRITNLSDPALSNTSVPVFQPYFVPRTDLSFKAPAGMTGSFNITQAAVDYLSSELFREFSNLQLANATDPAVVLSNSSNSTAGILGPASNEIYELNAGSLLTMNSHNEVSGDTALAALFDTMYVPFGNDNDLAQGPPSRRKRSWTIWPTPCPR